MTILRGQSMTLLGEVGVRRCHNAFEGAKVYLGLGNDEIHSKSMWESFQFKGWVIETSCNCKLKSSKVLSSLVWKE